MITAVMPSSARAQASGPASSARPATSFAATPSASSFAWRVVAADERVLVGRLVGAEAGGGERVQPGGDGCVEHVGEPLGDASAPRRAAARRRARRRARTRRRARASCRSRPRARRAVSSSASAFVGEHDEVGAAHGLRVARALCAERARPSSRRALGVARADHDLVAGRDEPLGQRGAERARAAHDRDPHASGAAAASSVASARRRRASASVISVRVTIGRTSRPSSVAGVALVEHERVDQPRVAAGDMARRVPPARRASIRSAGPLTARPPTSGLTATAGARRRSSAARIGRHREDRPDAHVGVAGREHDHVRGLERVHDAGRRPRVLGAGEATASTSSAVAARDEPLLERERAGGRVEPGAEPVVGGGQERAATTPSRAAISRRDRARAGRRARRACVRTRCRPRSRSPSRNQLSPPSAATVSSACQRLVRAAPAALLVGEPGERVDDRVEVGRDVQAEHLDVVADVADDGQALAGRTPRRGRAGTARRRRRPTARRRSRRRELARRPRRVCGAEAAGEPLRSASVSTSSARFGRSSGPRRRARVARSARALPAP